METKKVLVPAGDGCEEIETVAIIDILRRAGAHVDFVSITEERLLKGSNGISLMTDDFLKNKIN
jgi:protein deglycase